MADFRAAVRRHLEGSDLSPATEAEVADELVQHLEDRFAELRRRGLDESEAEAAVLSELTSADAPLGQQVARTRGVGASSPAPGGPAAGPFAGLPSDVRFAARTLRRSPGYAAVVILTLALGIGAAATAQSVIDPLLLRPLPFGAPARLVTLDTGVMPGEFVIVRDAVTSFEALSLHRGGQAWGLSGDGDAERLIGATITPEFFTTLRVRPLLGALPDADGAREVSIHFVVDSARLRLDAASGYQHVIYYSEWEGEVGGPPQVRRFQFKHGDFGEWQRNANGLGFVSHWLQNHAMQGTLGADGVLRVWHGLGHGEQASEFRYAR